MNMKTTTKTKGTKKVNAKSGNLKIKVNAK